MSLKILESVLYAEDLVAAREFYREVLGLEEIAYDVERDLFLRCQGSVLIVFKASKTIVPDSVVPPHGSTGPGHLAFNVTEGELETWRKKLTNHQVEIVKSITWKNGAKSLYFLDPAGNVLEFATPNLWGL